MTDFIYDRSGGVLTGHGQEWAAVSGIQNRFSPIANGTYMAPAGSLMAGKSGYGVPYDEKYRRAPFRYTDKKGFSWFFWLGLGDIGIHPDGNLPGTEGCIGITDHDTSPLFYLLRRINTAPVTVWVK